jgi:hypothetical protein
MSEIEHVLKFRVLDVAKGEEAPCVALLREGKIVKGL